MKHVFLKKYRYTTSRNVYCNSCNKAFSNDDITELTMCKNIMMLCDSCLKELDYAINNEDGDNSMINRFNNSDNRDKSIAVAISKVKDKGDIDMSNIKLVIFNMYENGDISEADYLAINSNRYYTELKRLSEVI